ncbi:MAG: primosomal protein N' [Bacteroidales bacterium]|jgi:primosomal protein N' (replication factor Y)|nr:primosomal protein N' [Bacteroidales bacterium]NPV37295.1 primosomal protein N' [Bacteroidales bacterium]
MTERRTFFADVLLPLSVEGYFTYRIPHEMVEEVAPGKRVVVQFGRQKIYTALVRRVHENIPQGYTPKYILAVIDPHPLIQEEHFRFWEWLASYYMCTAGEVMNAALPAALRLASETRIVLNPSFNRDYNQLSEKEALVAEACELHNEITLNEAGRISGLANPIALVKRLIDKGVVLIYEELENRFTPREVTMLSISPEFQNEHKLNAVFNHLEKKAPRQSDALMVFLSLTGGEGSISRSKLTKALKGNSAGLEGLLKKNILQAEKRIISRFEDEVQEEPSTVNLSPLQEETLVNIHKQLEEKQTLLLHGVTSSGKTEIYIRLMQEVVASGGQVLYLLPEIALTGQIIRRLKKYFGEKVGVYHSRYNERERAEVWNRVSAQPLFDFERFSIVAGARSALFLPFSQLRLIIVDEEHDSSFYQMSPAPRYHARDAAIYLAHLTGARVILGSATPSLESYNNAQNGKYGFVALKTRFGDIQLPKIELINLATERKENRLKSIFSERLLQLTTEALNNNEQVIMFQNRRGYAPRIECNKCYWIPSCRHCDVSMVYHLSSNLLKCHYCGYSTPVPSECPVCHNTGLQMKSFGTERIEDELAIFFPEAHIARLDLDAVKNKNAHDHIIRQFEDREIDILVGTQMVTKGLDFDHVSVVGILHADSLLAHPDFRAFERAYQLMAQVSGRAGRRNKQGTVIIQANNPEHPAIRYVVDNDYEGMYMHQMNERRKYNYPPYSRLILIEMKHPEKEIVEKASEELGKLLKTELKDKVLGPEAPPVSRIRGQYIRQIMLKLDKSGNMAQIKTFIKETLKGVMKNKAYARVQTTLFVDPA